MKKSVLFVLILSLLLQVVSCASAPDDTKETAESHGAETTAETEETVPAETLVKPDLPEDLDFEGYEFGILNNNFPVPGWAQVDIGSEGLDGTLINDAVFERNTRVEDTYNCKVMSRQVDSLHAELIQAVAVQDHTIDVATPLFMCGEIGAAVQSGLFVDLNRVTSMDLSKPWYDQQSVQELEILGKQYFVSSDLTIGDEKATAALVFNKQIYEDYGYAAPEKYGSLYEIVKDGKWTLDVLQNMVFALSKDLDGNGKMDDKDLYGLLYQRDSTQSFINSFDMRLYTINGEGVPELSLLNEANSNKLDALFRFLYNQDSCFHVMNFFDKTTTNFTTGMCDMFIGNQALFMWMRFADVEMLRTMDVDFGIIPVPKYDEAQEKYLSGINPHMGLATTIPQCCSDPERAGMFLEAICSQSRQLLTPAYYNVNLQGKISRDEESREMLDLIFENRIFDIGAIYNFGGLGIDICFMSSDYNADYASMLAKGEKMRKREMQRFVKKFSELD